MAALDGIRQDSNIERLLSAFRHEKADRVPNFEILIDARSIREILGNPDLGTFWEIPPAEAVRFVRTVGQDAIACSLTWIPPDLICSEADADRVVLPDVAEARARLKTYTDAVRGTGVGVCARLSCPLSLVYNSTGPTRIESFMYMLYDNPGLIDRLMAMYLDYNLRLLDAIADLPFHFFYLGDDISSTTGPLISPAHLETLWAPVTEKLIGAVKATGRPILFHCCGKQEPLLPYLVKWGVEATHPLQPSANDIYAIHEQYGKELTLVGNMDIAGVLWHGTPEEVEADTSEHIRRLAGDGGYVVCSSHSIIDDIPPANYLAMVRTAHQQGKY